MIEARAREIEGDLTARLCDLDPGLVETFPVGYAIAILRSVPPEVGYSAVPELLRARQEVIEGSHGDEARALLNRLLLARLLTSFESRARAISVPPGVRELTESFIEGILVGLETGRGRFRFGDDRFAKDLAVARLKLFPCGPELIDLHGGIPRRNLLHPPLSRIPGRLAFVLGRMGGFAPVLESHLDRRLAPHFSAEGYEALYRRMAGLLQTRPGVRGYLGPGTWFCDPAVSAISPELGFLVDLPLANGARVFPVETDDATRADAIRMSPARRDAHDAGAYEPRSYMMVWPRKSLMEWAGVAESP